MTSAYRSVNDVGNTGGLILVIKKVTFDGTAGHGLAGSAIDIAEITGAVILEHLNVRCTVNIVAAGGTMLDLGTPSQSDYFIGPSNDVSAITAGQWFQGGNTAAAGSPAPDLIPQAGGAQVTAEKLIATPHGHSITGGAVEYEIWCRPASGDGQLVAA